METSLSLSQKIVRVCLYLIAAIALFGGTVQMYLGEPETTPRLDNVHRFMAGVYFSCGVIAAWTGMTIRRQNTLIYLVALGAFLGGIGRLISMSIVGIPEPHALWLGYVTPELSLPIIMVIAQWQKSKSSNNK